MATQEDVEKWKAAFLREERVRKQKRERIRAYRKTQKGIEYTKRTQASERYKEYQRKYYLTVTKKERKK